MSGQIIREYLVVATRPIGANGLGLSPRDALRNVQQFGKRATFFDESEAVSMRLRSLVGSHRLTGKSIHDANVVAVMASQGIRWLVTENPYDFKGFGEIRTISLPELMETLVAARLES